jgi:hypothetical protein
MKELERIYLDENMLVQGNLGRKAKFTKGVEFSGLQYLNASESHLLAIQSELVNMIKILKPGMSLQILWELGHDYQKQLDVYSQRTALAKGAWCRRERENRHAHYLQAMEQGQLRRERSQIFLVEEAEYRPASGSMDGVWTSRLNAMHSSFENALGQFEESAKRVGASARILTQDDLFSEYYRNLNPSCQERNSASLIQKLRPEDGLMESCLNGEFLPFEDGADSLFYYDHHFHAALVLKNPPQATLMGMMTMLTHLPLSQLRMSSHIVPLDARKEIEKEQKACRKLRRAYQQSGNPEYATLLSLKEVRVDGLVRGDIQPARMQMVFLLRAENQEKLSQELQVLKAGIDRFYGASFHSLALPTSLRDVLLASLPGNPKVLKDFYHYYEQTNLSHLLPLTGMSSSSQAEHDAIYHSWTDHLIGVSCFSNGQPMHILVVGGTGSGKSMFVMGFLTQTMDEFDFTVILDDGQSHLSYAQLELPGVKPLVIDRNGQQTLNYLDTQGLPFTSFFLSETMAVLRLMLGNNWELFHEALLEDALRQFYHLWYSDWKVKKPKGHQKVIDEANLLCFYRDFLAGNDPRAANNNIALLYVDFQSWREENPELVKEWEGKKHPTTLKQETLAELGFSFLEAEEMPTHSDFHDWFKKQSSKNSQDQESLRRMALCLKRYRREKSFGCLLDGINTIKFDQRLVYIELSNVRESTSDDSHAKRELEQLVVLILTRKIRNEIMRRPRSQKKRVVFEEGGSFVEIPGGASLLNESMRTYRKYGCVAIPIVQQLTTLKKEVRETIKGNISQAILLKPKQQDDLKALEEVFSLPESTVEIMDRFEDPSKEKGAAFVHWCKTGSRAEIQVGYNQVSPEMLMVGTTTGEEFDRKRKLEAEHGSVMKAVVAEGDNF